MYTVQKLATLAGVSARTLRYYDSIGVLTPQKNESGYRMYGRPEIDRLQLILFDRELGFGLHDIAKLLDDPDFDEIGALLVRHLLSQIPVIFLIEVPRVSVRLHRAQIQGSKSPAVPCSPIAVCRGLNDFPTAKHFHTCCRRPLAYSVGKCCGIHPGDVELL